MLASIVLALVWQGGDPLRPTPLPRPTGRNGYEEYVQASEILKGGGLVLNWQPGMKPPARDPEDPDDKGPSPALVTEYARLNAMTPLEVRREAVRRFGKALTLIAQGNTKPVFDPRVKVDLVSTFPELAGFRQIARFATSAATVYAADGRTDLATKTLLDQLTFGDNFGRGVMIANLVGIATSAIAVRGFEELLPRMSQRDAETVSSTIGTILGRKPSAIDTMAAEAVFARSAVQMIAEAKPGEIGQLTADEEEPDPATNRLNEEFVKLTPAGRKALFGTVERKLQERLQRRIRILQGPEKSWIPGLTQQAEMDGDRPATLADYLVMSIDGSTATQFVQASLRTRAQLRVVRLYAQAIAYRWETGKWPAKIDAVDPLTEEPFLYEVKADGTIKIASKGTKETGEIGLRYQAPKPVEEVRP